MANREVQFACDCGRNRWWDAVGKRSQCDKCGAVRDALPFEQTYANYRVQRINLSCYR